MAMNAKKIGIIGGAVAVGALSLYGLCSLLGGSPKTEDVEVAKPKQYVARSFVLPDKTKITYQFEVAEDGYSHAWETFQAGLAEERIGTKGQPAQMTLASLALAEAMDKRDGSLDHKIENEGVNGVITARRYAAQHKLDGEVTTPFQDYQKEYDARIEAAKGVKYDKKQ